MLMKYCLGNVGHERSKLVAESGNVKIVGFFQRIADAQDSIVQCEESRVLGEVMWDLKVTPDLMC